MLSQIWGKGKYLSDHRRPFLTTQPYSPLFDETRNRYYTIPPFSKWDLEVWILVLYKDILAQRFSTRKTILKNIVKFTRKILYWSLVFFFFRSVFFFTTIHESQDCKGRGRAFFLTPHYHFYRFHRHLDISRVITAESSPLHIGSSRTRTGNLWFPSASC